MAHAVRHADEVEAQHGVFKAMRQELGATAFGVNQLQLGSGAEGPEHDHSLVISQPVERHQPVCGLREAEVGADGCPGR